METEPNRNRKEKLKKNPTGNGLEGERKGRGKVKKESPNHRTFLNPDTLAKISTSESERNPSPTTGQSSRAGPDSSDTPSIAS